MKKLFILICILSMVLCVDIYAVDIAYLQTSDGLAYSINDNNEVVIEGTAGYISKVVIPDEIDDIPVRYIKEYAFYNNPNITSVTISDNVINIGKEAFGNCQELSKVILPSGLETIEAGTFIRCGMLKDIELPDTLKSIDDFAFQGCTRLKELTIPASVEYIGHEVFITCESLLMDVSLNEYAAEYALQNSIETEYKSSWEYVFLICVILTVSAGTVCLIAYTLFKRARKHN